MTDEEEKVKGPTLSIFQPSGEWREELMDEFGWGAAKEGGRGREKRGGGRGQMEGLFGGAIGSSGIWETHACKWLKKQEHLHFHHLMPHASWGR